MRRLALGCVVLAACAARPAERPVAAPPLMVAARPPIAAGPAADPHAQIDELAKQIDAQRDQLGLPAPVPPPIAEPVATPMSAPVSSKTDPQCHPGASETCQDSCGLSDSICDNAKKICDLAAQLPGDTWAAQKCADGNASCDAAHQKCCGCQP